MDTQWFSASEQLVTLFLAVVALSIVGWLGLVMRGALTTGRIGAFSVFGLVVAGWMATALGLAEAGVFFDFSVPPKLLVFVLVGTLALSVALWKTPLGPVVDAVPLGAWILLQGFRLPLELVMHQAAREGVMPPQMTFTGMNFDIVTGVTALFLGTWLLSSEKGRGIPRVPRPVVWVWNVAGVVLLLAVVTIGALSLPSPFRVFENDPPNVWVTMPPFVLLPAVLVVCAAWTHVLVTKRLLEQTETREASLGETRNTPGPK